MRQLGNPGRAQVPDPAVEERRQRAREAAYDEGVDGVRAPTVHVEAAIEVATRVRITDEVIEAMGNVTIARGSESLRTIAAAAFRAAGFEVEQ